LEKKDYAQWSLILLGVYGIGWSGYKEYAQLSHILLDVSSFGWSDHKDYAWWSLILVDISSYGWSKQNPHPNMDLVNNDWHSKVLLGPIKVSNQYNSLIK
jgi:hypothetical protein